MSEHPTLLIDRCSFWPEARDPEAWFRALVTLSEAAEKFGTESWTSSRAIGETVLRGHLSRRAVPGLFGLDDTCDPPVLHGVGLLVSNGARSAWELSPDASALLTTWQTTDHRLAVEQLAVFLLRRSVWLRLALLKLRAGTWQLSQWNRLKAANGQLRVGKNLLIEEHENPSEWLVGLEVQALGAWSADFSPVTVQVRAPKTAKPEDGLSLSPLKSPLYLLDTLGWLECSGRLRLPPAFAQEPFLAELQEAEPSPAALLDQLTHTLGDHRGVFPLESVMLRLAEASGVFRNPAVNNSTFIAWTDRLLSEAFRIGVIELFSSEPGQPRHGRGLFGDPHQKLLRWRVHPGFDELYVAVSSAFHEVIPASTI